MPLCENELLTVFNKNNESELKKSHLLLNEMYNTILFGEDEENALEQSKINELRALEALWIQNEKMDCLLKYDCTVEVKNSCIVQTALKKHSVYNHPLFDYLRFDADLIDLKNFILGESVLNLEFFDYLALSIIGVSDQAKAEIIANMWDEAGRGKIQRFHTTMFMKLMTDLGLNYKRESIIKNMTWQGLAGINLFSYFSFYSYNKTKYFGMLAATEMLDPPHYNKLISGIKRILNNHKIDYSYYVEHEIIDIDHANGWLNKVILPELSKKPHRTTEFWLGFYMRLESMQKYYDRLLDLFLVKEAA